MIIAGRAGGTASSRRAYPTLHQYLLPTTHYLLPTTHYLLPTTYYPLPTLAHDHGAHPNTSPNPNPNPNPNPHPSPNPNPNPHPSPSQEGGTLWLVATEAIARGQEIRFDYERGQRGAR